MEQLWRSGGMELLWSCYGDLENNKRWINGAEHPKHQLTQTQPLDLCNHTEAESLWFLVFLFEKLWGGGSMACWYAQREAFVALFNFRIHFHPRFEYIGVKKNIIWSYSLLEYSFFLEIHFYSHSSNYFDEYFYFYLSYYFYKLTILLLEYSSCWLYPLVVVGWKLFSVTSFSHSVRCKSSERKQPLINNNIRSCKRECRKTERRWKKSGVQVHNNILKDLFLHYNNVVKDARTLFFRTYFCSST